MKNMSELVAEFLKIHLALNNMNKSEVAKLSGVNRTTICALVASTAKCGPRIDIIKPVLNAMNTDLTALELFIDSRTKVKERSA